jgi:hypothetical protein
MPVLVGNFSASESGHTHIQHPQTGCRHRLCLRIVCARPHLPRPARKTNPVWSPWPCRLSSSARFFNLRFADSEMRRTVAADAGQTRHDPARAGRHDPCMAEKPCNDADSGVIVAAVSAPYATAGAHRSRSRPFGVGQWMLVQTAPGGCRPRSRRPDHVLGTQVVGMAGSDRR